MLNILFALLQHDINFIFYPSLLGGAVAEPGDSSFSPPYFEGLGINNSTDSAFAFQSSLESFALLVNAIINHETAFWDRADHLAHPDTVHSTITRRHED